MRTKKNGLNGALLSLVLMCANASHAASYELKSNTFFQGVVFQANTTMTTFDRTNSPTPETGVLGEPYSAAGITWKKGLNITFDNRMNVISGTAESGIFNDRSIFPGLLNFYPNGIPNSIAFTTPTPLPAYNVSVPATTTMYLYEDGSIRVATTDAQLLFTARGTPKPFRIASGLVHFWPYVGAVASRQNAGPVKQGVLVGDHFNKREVLPSGSTVTFDAAGELTSFECPSTCSYKDIVLNDGGNVEILRTGEFTLLGKQRVTVKARTYPAGQRLLLTYEGVVIAAAAPQ